MWIIRRPTKWKRKINERAEKKTMEYSYACRKKKRRIEFVFLSCSVSPTHSVQSAPPSIAMIWKDRCMASWALGSAHTQVLQSVLKYTGGMFEGMPLKSECGYVWVQNVWSREFWYLFFRISFTHRHRQISSGTSPCHFHHYANSSVHPRSQHN